MIAINLVLKISNHRRLGIINEGGAGTYLGMPESFNGSKVEIFSYIKDKLKTKLSGWCAKFLSQEERKFC